MSATPRTDAAEELAARSPYCSCRHVDREEMAKLETELAAEKAKTAKLFSHLEIIRFHLVRGDHIGASGDRCTREIIGEIVGLQKAEGIA